MLAAIFGVIGVLVGGIVTAGVQWLDRWLNRRDRRRVAVRMVADELEANLRILRTAAKYRRWWGGDRNLRSQALEEYRTELAGLFGDSEWDTLRHTQSALSWIEADRERALAEGEGPAWRRRVIGDNDALALDFCIADLEFALEAMGFEAAMSSLEELRTLVAQLEHQPTALDIVRASSGFTSPRPVTPPALEDDAPAPDEEPPAPGP